MSLGSESADHCPGDVCDAQGYAAFDDGRTAATLSNVTVGVGLVAVAAGVDMFDCVLPTRNGRNALAFTREGTIRLRNARFADDPEPIEAGCDCEACAGGFSRGYLRHLFQAGEMLGPTLVSIHNVRLYQRLMLDIRRAIGCNRWSSLAQAWPCLSAAPDDTPGDTE